MRTDGDQRMTNDALVVNVRDHVFKLANGETLQAIDKVSFSLPANSFTCIVGPSGCGKTTVLRMILGLDTHYQGEVDLLREGPVSAVFQEPRLLPWRTVEQNIRLVLPKARQDESLEELFDVLGLSEMRSLYPNQLSLGLARRASLARAFVLEPQLLILDEPFVSLDEATAERLRQLLLTLWQSRPTTVLMVTHDITEAAALADTVLVFSKRPASIVGSVDIQTPRDQRGATELNNIRQSIAALTIEE
ncbi:MAG: NitT/TauT family transport system ATP-binding protein [Granulosicoccus sp.]|jgi:NitT/TauT family transport system ATP-binding protein